MAIGGAIGLATSGEDGRFGIAIIKHGVSVKFFQLLNIVCKILVIYFFV